MLILATFTNNYLPALLNVTVQTTTFYIVNMNQITYLTFSPLLIGHDVGDLKKPHHGSIASDPMPYISNDMINTYTNPFFDQSYCSWQTKQFKNSAFHFLMTHNVVSSDTMTTRSSAMCAYQSYHILITLVTRCIWNMKPIALISRKK